MIPQELMEQIKIHATIAAMKSCIKRGITVENYEVSKTKLLDAVREEASGGDIEDRIGAELIDHSCMIIMAGVKFDLCPPCDEIEEIEGPEVMTPAHKLFHEVFRLIEKISVTIVEEMN